MRTRRIVEVVALLAICAAAVAMLWKSPQAPPAVTVIPDVASGYSIAGVVPEMTRAEVEALLGPGRTLQVLDGVETTVYGDYHEPESPDLQDRWVTVTWDGRGRADEVRGSHLHHAGREVLGRGWKELDALRVLGPPHSTSSSRDHSVLHWTRARVDAVMKDGRIVSFALPLGVQMSGPEVAR